MRVEKSFLKWPGGKGAILDLLLPHFTTDCRFIEPFVGAGNVFINTSAESFILADSNRDLIDVYVWLKCDLAALYNATKDLFDGKHDFYDIRNQFNQAKCRESVQQAARFIWLNRHCFNGICRYNKAGKFNVPVGKHKKIYFPGQELINFSNKLVDSDVSLFFCDFSTTIELAESGDVVYCDPPYLSMHKDSFVGYTANGFDLSKTITLEKSLYRAVERGATAVISNCDNSATRDIFQKFKIHSISAPRRIAANGNRTTAKEIIGILTPDML